jgi:hypothetical protein
MSHVSLIENILEYFIDLDVIIKKMNEFDEMNKDCIGLDLQFYFEERESDIQKLLKEIKQDEKELSKIKIIGYFMWLIDDFRKLVDNSESNCNQWQEQKNEIERKRLEIDQFLTNEKEIQLKIG